MNPQHQYYMSNGDGQIIIDDQYQNFGGQYNVNMNDIDESQLDERNEVHFKNGATYAGQWLGNMKHGYGVQVWKDGAKYEGHWRFNKACGHGKFWHVDGDIFEGEWLDDKANGYGVYIH